MPPCWKMRTTVHPTIAFPGDPHGVLDGAVPEGLKCSLAGLQARLQPLHRRVPIRHRRLRDQLRGAKQGGGHKVEGVVLRRWWGVNKKNGNETDLNSNTRTQTLSQKTTRSAAQKISAWMLVCGGLCGRKYLRQVGKPVNSLLGVCLSGPGLDLGPHFGQQPPRRTRRVGGGPELLSLAEWSKG